MQVPLDPPPIVRQATAEDLSTHRLADLAALTSRAKKSDLASMSLRPLGLDQGQRLEDTAIVFTTKQVSDQKSPAAVSATRGIDSDRDGQVSAGELRRFAFAADQLGDKDGTLSVGEYNRLFSIGQQRHLLELGKKVGLSQQSLKLLEGRFASGRFGLSGVGGLPDAIDVAQICGDPFVTAQKSVAFIGLFERGLEAVPKTARDPLSAAVLEHLAKTGVTLIPIETTQRGGLVLAGDSVVVSQGPKGSTEYRFKSETYQFSPETGKLTSTGMQISQTPLTLLDESRYNYAADASNPVVERAIKDFEEGLKQNQELKTAIKAFLTASETTPPKLAELQALLDPIQRELQSILRVSDVVPLEVRARDPQNPDARAVYSHPKPGAQEQASIKLFLVPYISEARDEMRALIDSGAATQQQAQKRVMASFQRAILSTLVEENFHANQHQLADQHQSDQGKTDPAIAKRVADYVLNREFLVTPGDIVQFTGDTRAYERQPIEADAKRFRERAVDLLIGTR